jgi:hypothetical protein
MGDSLLYDCSRPNHSLLSPANPRHPMTRAINATLTAALANGTGTPFLKAYLGYGDSPDVIWSGALIAYKLTGDTLQIEIKYQGSFAGDQTAIWIERGVTIAGTAYTLTSGKFWIHSQDYLRNGSQLIIGKLFPRKYYSAAGDVSYKTVIDAFCTAFGKTAVYRDAGAAWLNYQFLPDGKFIITNDANSMAALLAQKWLIFYCDNGGSEVLFYSCDGSLVATDLTISANTVDFHMETTKTHTRYLLWRDEAGTLHTQGSATDPIHNLGYIESTAAAPARNSTTDIVSLNSRPDFRILDGDKIALVKTLGTVKFFALVTETYEAPTKSHPEPRWETVVDTNPIFGNTAGGALPSTIERVSNYTPLNTSTFNHILSAADNNLQAAMNTLDDMLTEYPFATYLATLPLLASGYPYIMTVHRPFTATDFTLLSNATVNQTAVIYWTYTLYDLAFNVMATLDTKGQAANTWYRLTTKTFNFTDMSIARLGAIVLCTKVGAAGNLYVGEPKLIGNPV